MMICVSSVNFNTKPTAFGFCPQETELLAKKKYVHIVHTVNCKSTYLICIKKFAIICILLRYVLLYLPIKISVMYLCKCCIFKNGQLCS